MPHPRPASDVVSVLELKAAGHTDQQASSLSGVPVATIRNWRQRGPSRAARRAMGLLDVCATCGEDPHGHTTVPTDPYAYLLGVYLGDGSLRGWGTSWILRIALDVAYPGIVRECCDAIEAVRGGHRPTPKPDYGGKRCIRIESTWRRWPCLFPQHGPGRKHSRKIELVDWQRDIVDQAPGAFLRGLIHTDGSRGVNRVHAKGKDYEYPRYQFSNRSDDIRRLFTDTCEKLGIRWRQWTRYHVSVARRESVAILDSFVGPKS